MPIVQCPMNGCVYATDDVDPAIAAVLLTIHNNVHTSNVQNQDHRQKAPKIDRPSISKGSSEEIWNAFSSRWTMFKDSTELTAAELLRQLFQCCDEDLGNDILKGHSNAIAGTEAQLLDAIKKLAVIPVAVSVRRSDLLSIKQNDGENARSFYARINGKAVTCSYHLQCPSDTCTQDVDFTEVIVKDVLISGLCDDEIRKEVLGLADLDNKSVHETVTHIEAKEMARDALRKHSVTAISSYRKQNMQDKQQTQTTTCMECKVVMEKYIWSKRRRKMVERTLCNPCWSKTQDRHERHDRRAPRGVRSKGPTGDGTQDEAGAIIIGSVSSSSVTFSDVSSNQAITLDHLIFNSQDGWTTAESMQHPTLQLNIFTEKSDYDRIGKPTPHISHSRVTVVTDTGAQSCLWGLEDYLRCGFKKSQLLPVRHTLYAANKETIQVVGAILLRMSGTDTNGTVHTAAVMAYVSPSTKRFYLSREALIQLGVIPKNFPRIGSALNVSAVNQQVSACGCLTRTLPPSRPDALPFPCKPENNELMKSWLVERFAPSTFNKCTHQLLPGMTGPCMRMHADPTADPTAVHTPAMVALHWQDQVEKEINDDIALGVLEKVPIGEPSKWCHRMVITRKADGGPRRTVDLSPLNRHCLRETHHVKPPYQQAKMIPAHTWKSVVDAWNGYHSVPLHPGDRHLTTFITPWGRHRYRVAPQGGTASGDGYSRRYDEIIADVERKTKCVDDTVLWDDESELEQHWWRMVDHLELLGRNGIVLNVNKFQFARKEIDFAGFKITETEVKPLDKYLRAIRDFPTPTKIADVRSWFGLVNQVSHYGQLSDTMAPFKALLSPKSKFVWTKPLDDAFKVSKEFILQAIKHGVQIFDLERKTCLRTDYSKTGIGFYLSQKHCDCTEELPNCCESGWKITLAGSRFLKPAESRYVAIEGEALAIAWALEQTKYFTQGCDRLLVVTDHAPLIKILGDRQLDQIANPRLFRLKQRTLPWRFMIKHLPGKSNLFSDATSRSPVDDDNDEVDDDDDMELGVVADAVAAITEVRTITWEILQQEMITDPVMQELVSLIETGIPSNKAEVLLKLRAYWDHRDHLSTVDGVVLFKHRIVVPPALRQEVLRNLHAAHQGVCAMNERAKTAVYWPGITDDIQSTRSNCDQCNRIAPSQPLMPPTAPWIPTTPFEAVVCDYFHHKGWLYLVMADRLSGWTEVSKVKQGTGDAGAGGLCTALRKLFSVFGVPVEISSDGGPEFASKVTTNFFRQWGIRHRMSSAYFPSSNGRAELAVKSTKRLLMDNVSPNGELLNDKVTQALLAQRNTPDPGCKLSPAQVLFGRQLRDTLPGLNRDVVSFSNPQFSLQWRDAWRLKEAALRVRYVKSMETLGEHSRRLPSLNVGDQVFVQNQTGQFPKRWDRSGVVVEVKDHDQYIIKVAGTGRLTLRNRRFLRQYIPHIPQSCQFDDNVVTSLRTKPWDMMEDQGRLVPENSRQHHVLAKEPSSQQLPPIGTPRLYATNEEERSETISPADIAVTDPQRASPVLTDHPAPSETVHLQSPPTVSMQERVVPPKLPTRRSSRVPVPTKVYNACTGTYELPHT